MKFLLGYNMKIDNYMEDKNLVGSIFSGGGEWTNFQLVLQFSFIVESANLRSQ